MFKKKKVGFFFSFGLNAVPLVFVCFVLGSVVIKHSIAFKLHIYDPEGSM